MAKNRLLPLYVFYVVVCFCVWPVGRPVAQTFVMPDSLVQEDFSFTRNRLRQIYTAELGVREATGRNDGERIEIYLRYVGLGKGYEWCSAFVSYCHGQAGCPRPRNPWSPALFPQARVIWQQGKVPVRQPQAGDVFGVWNNSLGRIAHVGFVDQWTTRYLLTTEGNSNDAVERRRRPHQSIDKVADWLR
jgi:hypothetical protein